MYHIMYHIGLSLNFAFLAPGGDDVSFVSLLYVIVGVVLISSVCFVPDDAFALIFVYLTVDCVCSVMQF